MPYQWLLGILNDYAGRYLLLKKMLYSAAVGRYGGGRGHQSLIGTTIRVRLGSFKGCIGVIKEVKGQTVLVELEAQMKIITG